MADWSDINFAALQTDYIARLNTLLNRSQAVATEVETARGAQPTLLANINYLLAQKVNLSGLAADFQLNGYRMRGAPVPLYADELVNKSFAEGLAFATVLPAQSGNAGGVITTDGVTAAWSNSQGVTMNYLKRASRRALLSFIK